MGKRKLANVTPHPRCKILKAKISGLGTCLKYHCKDRKSPAFPTMAHHLSANLDQIVGNLALPSLHICLF